MKRKSAIYLTLSALLIISVIITIKTIRNSGTSGSDNQLDNNHQSKPNVIIVMTDDQGYGELSIHGNPVLKTPHLDQLAVQSLRLTDFHVAPMCTPTRGQLMTGIDAARNGAINVSSGRSLLDADLPTMADYFAKAGYITAIFGKWHLGDNYPFRPQDRGFDECLWFPSSHINSVPDVWDNDYFDDTYRHNGSLERYEGYCTDVFFSRAMEWMKTHSATDQPFFAYLPLNAPHAPHWVPEVEIQRMENEIAKSDFTNIQSGIKNQLVRYLAMVQNIDTNMGGLIEFLADAGLSDNTILIFLTDNGSTFGPYYYNAGMRGRKTESWEGGHRVPCFIRWPGGNLGIPRDVDMLTQVQDLLPTLIEFCEIETDSKTGFDGISLAKFFEEEAHFEELEERMLVINYSRMPFGFDQPSQDSPSLMRKEGSVVLWKNWRLLAGNWIRVDGIYQYEEAYILNDLLSDPMQTENVIDLHPQVAENMIGHLNAWWEKVREKANEPKAIVIGNNAENPMMLTACEWMDVFIDQQKQIRRGDRKNSYWLLEVATGGEYEFDLRRWPRETDLPLNGSLPELEVTSGTLEAGISLPIARARIRVGDIIKEKNINPEDKSVLFNIMLEPGKVQLQTWFDDSNENPLCGAYYVYVKRK